MDKAEAINVLKEQHRPVAEGQDFTVGFFEPEDAHGVTQLFYTVYGDGYPVDTFYIPEKLIAENRCGNIRSVVARTATGDIIAHVALYRSSAPNPNLFEFGLGLTLPAYRASSAFFKACNLLMQLVGKDGINGFFGEAVCNHTITQKLSRYVKSVETAVEPALMPAHAYENEQSAEDRVGCLLYARVITDIRRTLYMPASYHHQIGFILDELNLDRQIVYPQAVIEGDKAEIKVERFEAAGVARCTLSAPGADLPKQLQDMECELRSAGYALIQFFIDLGKPWSAGMVELLRQEGYYLGGLLPIWFGDDGLLMQKHFVDPGFDTLKIQYELGKNIVEMVKKDWQSLSQKGP